LDIGRAALIVVDMQNGFLGQHTEAVIPAVAHLARHWQDAGGATVFTRFVNAPGSPFERLLGWTQVATTPETDITASLEPHLQRAHFVLDKPAYTIFTPEGRQLIEAAGWSDLVFCGVDTDSCVLKSALDAFELGYTPWIATDATSSHGGPVIHEAGLAVAARSVGKRHLLTTAAILQSVQHTAHSCEPTELTIR
jgi:nicotinamidase-related amidase